jgi:peptide chain release factor 2
MAKDHRTNAESGNINAVMDGGINMFMNAYLVWQRQMENEANNS